MKVLLYLTDACSLCDVALDLIIGMPELAGCVLVTVDIVSNDALLERFEQLIPVLEIADQQLVWPFTKNDISNLVRTVSLNSLE